MIHNKEIRWKQRFENFEKAFRQLKEAHSHTLHSNLEKSGYIKTFEFTFELAWKTLKDFLESEGLMAESPRKCLQQAFQYNFIKDGHTWIDALEKRNLLSHTYNEKLSNSAIELIQNNYFSILENFYLDFKKR